MKQNVKRRQQMLTTRVSASELRSLSRQARTHGLSRSGYVRQLITAATAPPTATPNIKLGE